VSITPTEPPESAGPADSAAQADAPALRLYDSAARAVVPLASDADGAEAALEDLKALLETDLDA